MDFTEKLYHLYVRISIINGERTGIALKAWRQFTIHDADLPKHMFAMVWETHYKLRELTNLRKTKKELEQTIEYIDGAR